MTIERLRQRPRDVRGKMLPEGNKQSIEIHFLLKNDAVKSYVTPGIFRRRD